MKNSNLPKNNFHQPSIDKRWRQYRTVKLEKRDFTIRSTQNCHLMLEKFGLDISWESFMVVKFSLASFSLKKKDFSVKIEKKIYYSKSSVKFRSVVIRVPLILRRRGGKMSVCKRQKLLRRKIQLIFKSVEEKKIPDVLRSARWNNET